MFDSLKITISIEALYILHQLEKNNYQAYIVGGAVRDTLKDALGSKLSNTASSLTAADYDFTTNATPAEIQAIFPENFYDNNFGTVGVAKKHLHSQMKRLSPEPESSTVKPSTNQVIDLTKATKIHESLQPKQLTTLSKSKTKKEVYEVTTFRADGQYTDHRRPETVTWGSTLEEDLSRRDFTINAMAIRVLPETLTKIDYATGPKNITLTPEQYQVIDPYKGISDLEAGIIKTVGNPNQRFSEDALRMLRAVRFSVQLNIQIDDPTFEAIITNSHLIKHISFERISDELLKMLASDFPKEAIEILDETGLLRFIIPELLDGKGVKQAGHHTTDVWTHNLNALANCPSKDPIVRLATLLHDIAKPHTYKEINGQPTFYNHEIIGSRMAKKIARRLRLSKSDLNRIFILVRYHMFYYQPENTDASIRRFMRKVGLENLNDILDLREADRLGSGARKTSWRLEEMKQRMISQLHQPFSIKDLALNGHDLINHFKLKPGPKLGKILNSLFEKVLEKPELNDKEKLLELAKQLL